MADNDIKKSKYDYAAWTGHCECGGVAFEVRGPMRAILQCACKQCRRSGSTLASFTNTHICDLVYQNDSGVAWYRSSPSAQRGFCKTCGSSLFYKRDVNDHPGGHLSVAAGLLNEPVGLPVAAGIFAESAAPHDAFHPDAPVFDIVYPDDFVVPWFAGPGTPMTPEKKG